MRIEELRIYLVEVLRDMKKDFKTMDINFLSNEVDHYSIDKIPVQTVREISITGDMVCREVYNFRSRNVYGSGIATNLSNMGFWENFEEKIYSNNEKGILPKIDGITKISCLNCGSLLRAETQTCEMSIQIEIEYVKGGIV